MIASISDRERVLMISRSSLVFRNTDPDLPPAASHRMQRDRLSATNRELLHLNASNESHQYNQPYIHNSSAESRTHPQSKLDKQTSSAHPPFLSQRINTRFIKNKNDLPMRVCCSSRTLPLLPSSSVKANRRASASRDHRPGAAS